MLLGKSSFCSRYPSEKYCQSIICAEHTFDPGPKPLEKALYFLKEIKIEQNKARKQKRYIRSLSNDMTVHRIYETSRRIPINFKNPFNWLLLQ